MCAGGEVELLRDEDRPGGWLLLLDRVRQSYVDLEDPRYLEFPYVRVLAGVIGALPAGPLNVVHVGGGAATLPRWVAATRPGSVQVVFEPHRALLQMVRARLPLDPADNVVFHQRPGRAGVGELPPAAADVLVVDAFSGGRVPADLTTAEFFADVGRVLAPTGILLINTTDGDAHAYLKRLVAALGQHFAEILVHGRSDDSVGNVVIAAAALDRLPLPAVSGEDALSEAPSLWLSGPALHRFVDGAAPLTDADSMRSPQPPDETWRLGGE